MLNKRCRSILLEIIKQPKTTDELAHLYHVSNRSIRNDLNEINYFLKQNQFTKSKRIQINDGFFPAMRIQKK